MLHFKLNLSNFFFSNAHLLTLFIIYPFVYYCRMRDRGKQKVPPPKKTRPGVSRKAQKMQQMEKPRQLQKQVKASVSEIYSSS